MEKVVVFHRQTGKVLSGANAPTAGNLEKWLASNPGYEAIRSSKPNQTQNLIQSRLKVIKNEDSKLKSTSLSYQHPLKHQQQANKNLTPQKLGGLKIVSKQISVTRQNQKVKIIETPTLKSPVQGIVSTPGKKQGIPVQKVTPPVQKVFPKEKPSTPSNKEKLTPKPQKV